MKNIFNTAIFKENLKRYWSVSAIAFFVMYTSGLNNILNSRDYLSFYTMNNILRNQWFWAVYYAAFSIIAAFVVFSYLNTVKSTGHIHSMPVSRKSLFCTNYISGTVLYMIPIVITFIVLLVSIRSTDDGFAELASYYPEIYTFANVCSWFLQSICICCFTYSVAVFGIIISGNGVIAALTAISANGILPVIMLCLLAFAANSYFGFTSGSAVTEVLRWTSPFGHLLESFDYDSAVGDINWKFLIYLAVAVLISYLAYYLYSIRKLERTEEAYVFKPVQKIIGFIFVFVPCSLFGMTFYYVWGIMAYVYGGLFGFVIGQMITRKTFRIFDKECLKNLALFAGIMILIIASFSIDLFGYENNVPTAEEVERIEVSSYYFFDADGNGWNGMETEDQETIVDLVAFHQAIVDDKNHLKDFVYGDSFDTEDYSYMYINYVLKNGKALQRSYMIPSSWIENSEEFKALYEDFKKTENYIPSRDIYEEFEQYYNYNLENPQTGEGYYEPAMEDVTAGVIEM